MGTSGLTQKYAKFGIIPETPLRALRVRDTGEHQHLTRETTKKGREIAEG